MAKLSKLLVFCCVFCVLFCLVAFGQRALAEPATLAVVNFKNAPFAELVGRTKSVYLLPESPDGRLSIAIKADEIENFKSPGAKTIKQSEFGWLETRTEGRFARFSLPIADAIVFLPTACDRAHYLCRGDTVLDTKATAAAQFELEVWESMGQSIFKIAGIYTNIESESVYVQLSSGRLSVPNHLLKLRCEGGSSRNCEFVER